MSSHMMLQKKEKTTKFPRWYGRSALTLPAEVCLIVFLCTPYHPCIFSDFPLLFCRWEFCSICRALTQPTYKISAHPFCVYTSLNTEIASEAGAGGDRSHFKIWSLDPPTLNVLHSPEAASCCYYRLVYLFISPPTHIIQEDNAQMFSWTVIISNISNRK